MSRAHTFQGQILRGSTAMVINPDTRQHRRGGGTKIFKEGEQAMNTMGEGLAPGKADTGKMAFAPTEKGTMATEFAPAERLPGEAVLEQSRNVISFRLMEILLNSLPQVCLLLNRQRQIVFANRAFIELVNAPDPETILGLRPGEALDCAHAYSTQGGCGTSKFCSVCGAVRAILNAQDNIADVQETRILRRNGEALDLEVTVTPFDLNGQEYSFVVAQDKSSEKRRRMLERIFFHDVLNTASGIFGVAEMLKESPVIDKSSGEIVQMMTHLSSSIIEEIHAQRDLLEAESNELVIRTENADSLDILKDVVRFYKNHRAAKDKDLKISPDSHSAELVTDVTKLRRVIGNMVKNALEASKKGDTVTLGSSGANGKVHFSVHNPTPMPTEVQLQVFNRSFSTKGAGRGLGTYSIKLLTEKYLKGEVNFISTEEEGTTFFCNLPRELRV